MSSHARLAAVTVLLLGMAGVVPASADEGQLRTSAPSVRQAYVDVTAASGLGGFLHAGFLGNATSTAAFPEIMGPGMCWLDADSDGHLDLFLVNGRYHSEPEKEASLAPTSRLYRNLGAGSFADATAGSGTGLRAWAEGCSVADYDNDGDPDLFVSGFGLEVLMRNDGGVFTNVTNALGLGGVGCGAYVCWTSGATWFDGDRDGCMDLYVTRFGNYTLGSGTPNGPDDTPQQRNVYYEGHCGAPFTEATEAAGFTTWGNTWSAVAHDINLDGWSDLYVSNDRDPNELWLNDGDGTFTLSAMANNNARAGMGTAVGDLDANGLPDLVSTNFVNEDNAIYLQQTGGTFLDKGGLAPFTDARPYSGWATLIHDIDHDGRPDLSVVNGMTEEIGFIPTPQPLHVYRQTPAGTFEQWNRTLGTPTSGTYVGRGAAWADLDDDGDLDMALGEAGENPTHLFRMDRPTGNFLTLTLIGNAQNVTRDAEGARITLTATGIPTLSKEKRTQQGIHSSHDPRVHFGLGEATTADLTIRWPDGSEQTYQDVPANSFARIVQGAPLEITKRLPLPTATGPTSLERTIADTFTATLDADLDHVAWDFGDGHWAICQTGTCTDDAGATIGTMTTRTATITHAFDAIGEYDVRVTLRDLNGHELARRITGQVTGPLHPTLTFDAERFAIDEPARGHARVTYNDGTPVTGANVRIDIEYTFWPQIEDAALPLIPAGVRTAAGYRTTTLEGTTDTTGTWAFEVPLWWQSPLPAASAAKFNPIGDYHATMSGTYRTSTFGNATASYQVTP